MVLLYLLALLPGLLIALYVGRQLRILSKTIFWAYLVLGAVLAIPSYFLHQFALQWGILSTEDFLINLLFSLFAVGMAEELLKFLFLRYAIVRSAIIKKPNSIIRLTIILNMGSALTFHLFTMPMLLPDSFILQTLTLPAYLAVGVLMGGFLQQAQTTSSATTAFRYMNTALSAPLLLHGLFYFFWQQSQLANLAILSLGSLFLALFLVARLRRPSPTQVPQRDHGTAEVDDLYPPEEEPQNN